MVQMNLSMKQKHRKNRFVVASGEEAWGNGWIGSLELEDPSHYI